MNKWLRARTKLRCSVLAQNVDCPLAHTSQRTTRSEDQARWAEVVPVHDRAARGSRWLCCCLLSFLHRPQIAVDLCDRPLGLDAIPDVLQAWVQPCQSTDGVDGHLALLLFDVLLVQAREPRLRHKVREGLHGPLMQPDHRVLIFRQNSLPCLIPLRHSK